MNNNSLFLFTSSYPYGLKETYLEKELFVLSKLFKKIELFPLYYNDGNMVKRTVPANVYVHKPILPKTKHLKVINSIKGLFRARSSSIFVKDFINYKVFQSNGKLKKWFHRLLEYYCIVGASKYNYIKELNNSIFYFYWGLGWSTILLNDIDKTNKTFVRVHGGEVFLDRSNGYIPINYKVFHSCDNLISISDKLSNYLQKVYGIQKSKIFVSRLGVRIEERTRETIHKLNNGICLVSSSNVIPLKRIHLIIEALALIKNISVAWYHFGDGPEIKKMKTLAKKRLRSNIKYKFHGRLENKALLKFYEENYIDAFLNVSAHEGLPVSIMEAMSYKIPVIATDVGATSEIVNFENGSLLSKNFEIPELTKIILSLKSETWIKKRTKSFCTVKKLYNAEENYTRLSKILLKS